MTDKQIIETFKNIKEHCDQHNCRRCHFAYKKGINCIINILFVTLGTKRVKEWDMHNIERIINETD